jgi:hypothetical protein
MVKKLLLQLFFILLSILNLAGQKTVVRGSVIDADTREPVPFTNIVFQHSTSGAVTDNNGLYYIETYKASDTLVASCMSYISAKLPVKIGASQVINFILYPDTVLIGEVVVTPGKNPAFRILDKISERKKYNNPDRFSS